MKELSIFKELIINKILIVTRVEMKFIWAEFWSEIIKTKSVAIVLEGKLIWFI